MVVLSTTVVMTKWCAVVVLVNDSGNLVVYDEGVDKMVCGGVGAAAA